MEILLAGAGHIGQTIAALLAASGDYGVLVADRDAAALAPLAARGINTVRLDTHDPAALRRALDGRDALVNALPFTFAADAAAAAKDAGAHYFDLTEDVRATQCIRALADSATTAFMPQCGLAPGFVGIVAHALAQRFETVRDIKMRVGALPEFPTNALKYNLTWSIDGLINEYCQPCDAIRSGRPCQLQPLEGLERFALDGVEYEAFNTSGGLGTLCETLDGRVETLDYKSIRYPGHRDLIKFLLDDLRLADDRATLKLLMQRAVPITAQDVVLVFVTASGMRGGRFVQQAFSRKIFARPDDAHPASAIQIATAAGVCAALDLFRQKQLPQRGFIKQEQIELGAFLANRFGRAYDALSTSQETETGLSSGARRGVMAGYAGDLAGV